MNLQVIVSEEATARFLAFVIKHDCWEWTGAVRKPEKPYGVFRDADGQNVNAARYAYVAFVGPIPDELQLDHLCNNPRCVNPVHLEPVTNLENQTRKAERKLACPHGHAWSFENTRFKALKKGGYQRVCRTCHREAERRRRNGYT